MCVDGLRFPDPRKPFPSSGRTCLPGCQSQTSTLDLLYGTSWVVGMPVLVCANGVLNTHCPPGGPLASLPSRGSRDPFTSPILLPARMDSRAGHRGQRRVVGQGEGHGEAAGEADHNSFRFATPYAAASRASYYLKSPTPAITSAAVAVRASIASLVGRLRTPATRIFRPCFFFLKTMV